MPDHRPLQEDALSAPLKLKGVSWGSEIRELLKAAHSLKRDRTAVYLGLRHSMVDPQPDNVDVAGIYL